MKAELRHATTTIVLKLCVLTIAAISVTATVASQRRVFVAVDIGDRHADGNGYEDEKFEAAYRPRPRHPRDDSEQTPRFIITTAADLLSFPDLPTDRPGRKLITSRFRQSILHLVYNTCIVSPIQSLRNRRQRYVGTPSKGYHRGVSRTIIVEFLNIVHPVSIASSSSVQGEASTYPPSIGP